MKQEEIIGEGGLKIIKVYTTYTDSQKRATKKYRENNRAKVNEQRKVYYQKRKASDPTFLEYKRKKAREYYQSKKTKKIITDKKVLDKEIEKVLDVKPEPEPVVEKPLVIPELPEEKPKKTRTKKEVKNKNENLKYKMV